VVFYHLDRFARDVVGLLETLQYPGLSRGNYDALVDLRKRCQLEGPASYLFLLTEHRQVL